MSDLYKIISNNSNKKQNMKTNPPLFCKINSGKTVRGDGLDILFMWNWATCFRELQVKKTPYRTNELSCYLIQIFSLSFLSVLNDLNICFYFPLFLWMFSPVRLPPFIVQNKTKKNKKQKSKTHYLVRMSRGSLVGRFVILIHYSACIFTTYISCLL